MLPFLRNVISLTVDGASSNNSMTDKKDKVIWITKSEFLQPIKDDYVLGLSQLPPEEIFDDGYNPGPNKPDGSVNFECHCVSHLVASPCGHEFRKAISCQRSAKEEDLNKGACADEFFDFLKCAMRTQCFRMKDGVDPLDTTAIDKNGGKDEK